MINRAMENGSYVKQEMKATDFVSGWVVEWSKALVLGTSLF